MNTTMDLDDLKQAWQALDARLQRQDALQSRLLREQRLDAAVSNLRPLFWGQLLQIAFGIATIMAGAWLWSTFADIAIVFVAGIAVHVYGIVTVAAGGIVLERIARIDRSLPVLEAQRRLLRLRKAHIVSGAVVGLPWWLLWVVPPLLAMALYAQGAADAALPLAFWVWIAVGVAGLLGTLGFYRWSRRPGREALAQRLDDAAAGSSLRRAQAQLDELQRFMAEDDD